MARLKEILDDFISLVYPHCCAACDKALYQHEESICTICKLQLPATHFHAKRSNKVEELFWGRMLIEAATAFYYFDKGGKVQKLLHQLKYKGQKEVGVTLGKWYGLQLVNQQSFKEVDVIVPVPLHKNKLRQRGYNQSAFFAEGLGETMEKEVSTNNLYRAIPSSTQTRKTRFQRWQNVEGIFKVKQPIVFTGKHVLLVDDVVSTGSTLEACTQALLEIRGVKVSIATIACA